MSRLLPEGWGELVIGFCTLVIVCALVAVGVRHCDHQHRMERQCIEHGRCGPAPETPARATDAPQPATECCK